MPKSQNPFRREFIFLKVWYRSSPYEVRKKRSWQHTLYYGIRSGLPLQDFVILLLETNEMLPRANKLTDLELAGQLLAEFPHAKSVQDVKAGRKPFAYFRTLYNTGFWSWKVKPLRKSYPYNDQGLATGIGGHILKNQPKVWNGEHNMESIRAAGVEVLSRQKKPLKRKEQRQRDKLGCTTQKPLRGSQAKKVSAHLQAIRRGQEKCRQGRKEGYRRAARKRKETLARLGRRR